MEFLQRALREALDRNAAETVRWTQYKEQHEVAKANIEEFKKSLEVDIMVPIGSKALIPGRLYHTNEIVVSHSGTYYSKCSAHKALEICQSRLNVADNRLKALEAEANMHRNQLDLPLEFDAFSSQEIIETYDEEEEKRWQMDHRKKMKEHKRNEALERQKLMDEKDQDDIVKKLEELELMEELENELEAMSEGDDEAVHAILNGSVEPTSHKKRISHLNEQVEEHVSSSIETSTENTEIDSVATNSDDDDEDDEDDDDTPAEFKEIELKTASMTNKEKLKLFKAKLSEVQDYLRNFTPRTIEDISHKTDKMFLSDHLLCAIETIEDELNCEQYLNGETLLNDIGDIVTLPAVIPPSVPKNTGTILKEKKKISFAADVDVKYFDHHHVEEQKQLREPFGSGVEPKRKISFALEDDVKSFHVEEEPSKISTTIIFDHGPVLNLSINHSEAVFNESSEKSDVIRSPVDIYKQFAGCTLNEPTEKQRDRVVPKKCIKNAVNHSLPHIIAEPIHKEQPKAEVKNVKISLQNQSSHQEIKDVPIHKEIDEAKTEVKEMLDNMFGIKNENEPDPLPEGSFVDTHEPKKRVSLFKQRRQMKNQ